MKYVKRFESFTSNGLLKNEYTGDYTFYHGTTKEFDQFKKVVKMGVEGIETEQPIFLSEDIKEAEAHAGRASNGRILHINILDTAKIFDFTKAIIGDYLEYDLSNLSDEAMKLAFDIDDQKIKFTLPSLQDKDAFDIFNEYIQYGDYDVLESKGMKDWFIKNGYDGVYVKEFRIAKYKNLAMFNLDKMKIVYQQKI